MMRILERRILVTLATIFVATAFGVLGTLLLESVILIKLAENKLELDATNLAGMFDGFMDESQSLLTTMNASPYSFCSDAESAYLRKLLFQSQYLRDAGHMRDGRIKCSVVLGKEGLPDTKFEPAATFPNGIEVYNDFFPYYPHLEGVIGFRLLDCLGSIQFAASFPVSSVKPFLTPCSSSRCGKRCRNSVRARPRRAFRVPSGSPMVRAAAATSIS